MRFSTLGILALLALGSSKASAAQAQDQGVWVRARIQDRPKGARVVLTFRNLEPRRAAVRYGFSYMVLSKGRWRQVRKSQYITLTPGQQRQRGVPIYVRKPEARELRVWIENVKRR
jgi:hypothetical protein